MHTILKFMANCILALRVSVLASVQDFPLKPVPQMTCVVDYEASWSPDGRQIVLISNRHGDMKVHILDARSEGSSSEMRQVTSGPDGRQIAFVSVHGDVSDIFVMNADGRDVRQVVASLSAVFGVLATALAVIGL